MHGDFLEAGLVDRIYAFIAPKLIGGLADDDGAGAQDQDLFDIRILRHYWSPPIDAIKRSNRYSVSWGPGLASGWNWVVKQLGRL